MIGDILIKKSDGRLYGPTGDIWIPQGEIFLIIGGCAIINRDDCSFIMNIMTKKMILVFNCFMYTPSMERCFLDEHVST